MTWTKEELSKALNSVSGSSFKAWNDKLTEQMLKTGSCMLRISVTKEGEVSVEPIEELNDVVNL